MNARAYLLAFVTCLIGLLFGMFTPVPGTLLHYYQQQVDSLEEENETLEQLNYVLEEQAAAMVRAESTDTLAEAVDKRLFRMMGEVYGIRDYDPGQFEFEAAEGQWMPLADVLAEAPYEDAVAGVGVLLVDHHDAGRDARAVE